MNSPLIAFWPFTYTAMLWWAAAAAIPLAIHLLSRRRYRETNWAAMQFLLAAVKKHARRLRIEQLILLALRILVLVLLAAALADPSLYHRAISPAGSGGHTHWVLVLDGSYSMEYRQAGKSLFASAQDAARRLVMEAQQGDGFTLLMMGEPPITTIREPAFDIEQVLREIDELRGRHAGADLTATLREIREVVETAAKRQPRLKETRVCLYTDLGRRTWEATENEACRKLLGQLAQQARLHVFAVGENRWQNAAVMRLDVQQAPAIVDRDVQFTAEVRRFSPESPLQARAEWVVDQQIIREEQLDLTTGGDALSLTHRFVTPGEHEVELRLAGADPLDIDNHRWRVIVVRDSIRALCVEGKAGAARYLAAALEPRQSERPQIRWEIVNENALIESDLTSYDCVFLCNVGRLTSNEADALRSYVLSGGGLTIFLGDQVQLNDYNNKLGGGAGTQRILPVDFTELITSEQPLRFDPLEYQHPIVGMFAQHERAGLLTVPTWRYARMKVHDQARARVALAFDNGDPALVEQPVGRGRVVVFASSATSTIVNEPNASERQNVWSDFAIWPSFLPIVQQLVSLLVENSAASRQTTVGEPISGSLGAAAPADFASVTTPTGQIERVLAAPEALNTPPSANATSRDNESRAHAGPAQWRFSDTYWSGVYRTQQGNSPAATQLFAVNVNTAESHLDRYDPGLLPSQLKMGIDKPAYPTADDAAPYAPASYARWVLAALLGLLCLESYLAWYFGTARA